MMSSTCHLEMLYADKGYSSFHHETATGTAWEEQ